MNEVKQKNFPNGITLRFATITLIRERFNIFSSDRFWTSPERGGAGYLQSRIKVRPYFGPHLESRNRRVGGVKEGQSPEWFWENFSIIKVHFGVQKVLGGGDLSIESRLFLRNICHFEANLTFKSDFQSYFTFKKSSLTSPELEGGGRSSDLSPEWLWTSWKTHLSPESVKNRGGGNHSGLVQNLSEENILNLSLSSTELRFQLCWGMVLCNQDNGELELIGRKIRFMSAGNCVQTFQDEYYRRIQ